MSSILNVIITDAGIAEVVNAQHTGTAPVVLSQVGFGRGIYTPTASQTALHDEIKRVDTIAGGVVGDNIMHIQALDSGGDAYAVYEIGVYTASGTLFAVYSQPLPILHKVANSEIMCVIDFVLSGVEPTAVTVGDTNYTLAPATTTNQGVVELATNEEASAGTDTGRAVTPAAGAATYVMLTGDQTISGSKTFYNKISMDVLSQGIESMYVYPSTHGGYIGTITDYYHSGYFAELRVDYIRGLESGSNTGVTISSDLKCGVVSATDLTVTNLAVTGLTGTAPSDSHPSLSDTIDLPVGGIVAVWSSGGSPSSPGTQFTATAQGLRVASTTAGTVGQGAKYIPPGTYVKLMGTATSSATWFLVQRIA